MTTSWKLDQRTLEGLKSGALRVYVGTQITYLDDFEQRHWTQACMFLRPNLRSMRWCNFGNDGN